MTIKVGDRLPEAAFKMMTSDGLGEVKTADYFTGAKVALFAVPGAFTPTCHAKHVPGFLSNLDALKAKGVNKIACVSVNDAFVLDAWAEATGAKGKIDFLADGNGSFTKELGLDFDGSAPGLGTRSRRYSMLVDDGVVKLLNVEDVPSKAEASSAETLLSQI